MEGTTNRARRILIVDDNPAIHEDYRKIFSRRVTTTSALMASEAALFGSTIPESPTRASFTLESAFQGQQALELVRQAVQQGIPYSMAFVDVRMPPGLDGIETISRLWEIDPDVQIVICTAYSDYFWEDILEKLGHPDRFIVLKKPFDTIEVLQLAEALTEKWRLARQERNRFHELEEKIRERNCDLDAVRRINAQLDAANQRIMEMAGPVQSSQARDHAAMERDLRHGLEAHELSVHYQPLVEIASRRVVGLEALVRWHHPKRGAVAPVDFIPVAEETGLILALGEFVMRTVCEQLVCWQREEVPIVRTAVNLSAVQLEHPIWDELRARLRDSGLAPNYLALELTESALVRNASEVARPLQRLRDDGVEIDIDDFGTGYSSLSYLRTLPIDVIKIDRSFIGQVDTNSSDEQIVSMLLGLARNLGLHVVAEGVETPEQLVVLGKHGCEVAQGYYFSRPLPAEECRDLLLELAERTSFTDTLRLRLKRGKDGSKETVMQK